MRTFFPPPPAGQPFLTQFVERLTQVLRPVVSKDEATPRILLLDPDGVTWAVTVDVAGALTTAVISGKERDI